MPITKAFALAEEAGLDLILVADKVKPAVCRILDYGKLIYESKKRQKDLRKQHHAQKMKEIKFHVNIDPHDYQIKIKHAIEFLEKGNKLKTSLVFRGREAAHKAMGFEIIDRVIKDVEQFGHPENRPSFAGRTIIVTINPVAGHAS